jgi:DNA-binding Lrp family transcriptional regulator
MAKELDQTDRAIMRCLRANARMPLVALAREIGLSRSATQERLARLERNGQIAGYTLRTPPRSNGGITAWLHVTTQPGVSCTTISPQLRPLHDFAVIHSLAGKPDIAALVTVPDQTALLELRDEVAALEGVADVVSTVVLADILGQSG